MPVLFDTVATGHMITGPDTDTLTATWNNPTLGEDAGVILVGFKYDTNSPGTKSTVRTITAGGVDLSPMVPPMGQVGMGWGSPKQGWLEVWGGVGTALHTAISVGLAYDKPAGPFAPNHTTFSNFSGVSLSYAGADFLPDPALKKGISGRASAGQLISVPVSAFMDSLSVIFVASDGVISEDAPHANSRFLDSASGLWVGDHQGPGAVKLQSTGGNWGAVVVNLQPI